MLASLLQPLMGLLGAMGKLLQCGQVDQAFLERWDSQIRDHSMKRNVQRVNSQNNQEFFVFEYRIPFRRELREKQEQRVVPLQFPKDKVLTIECQRSLLVTVKPL